MVELTVLSLLTPGSHVETVISRICWGGTASGNTDIKYGDEWLFCVFYLVLKQWINQILSNNIQNNSESIWPSNSSEMDSVWDCQASRIGEESGGWELGGQIPTTWGSDSSVMSVPPVEPISVPTISSHQRASPCASHCCPLLSLALSTQGKLLLWRTSGKIQNSMVIFDVPVHRS